jgi:hypothetical protein
MFTIIVVLYIGSLNAKTRENLVAPMYMRNIYARPENRLKITAAFVTVRQTAGNPSAACN